MAHLRRFARPLLVPDIGESVLARLERLYNRAERILNDGEQAKDGKLALGAVRELRELLGGVFAQAKADGPGAGLPALLPILRSGVGAHRIQG